MKYIIDHDYHIHSGLSACSNDPEQNKETIFNYAKSNGFSKICITDHYWDSAVPGVSGWYAPQNFEHIAAIKPLPSDEKTKFLFGCETDMDKNFTIGTPKERFDDFDFIVIPTTHMHMHGFTIEDCDKYSHEAKAKLWTKKLDMLLSYDLPFSKIGIAHLACSIMDKRSRADYLRILDFIPDSDMERVFCRAAELGCGIELNQYDFNFADSEADAVLRPFRIAKSAGCKFYLGSDAHHPSSLNSAISAFSRAIDMLGLEEKDKFIIS